MLLSRLFTPKLSVSRPPALPLRKSEDRLVLTSNFQSLPVLLAIDAAMQAHLQSRLNKGNPWRATRHHSSSNPSPNPGPPTLKHQQQTVKPAAPFERAPNSRSTGHTLTTATHTNDRTTTRQQREPIDPRRAHTYSQTKQTALTRHHSNSKVLRQHQEHPNKPRKRSHNSPAAMLAIVYVHIITYCSGALARRDAQLHT